ncbi:phytochrome E-like [Cucurbita pepo subsp. pepo]|uniref:phytochrome E-like n=1 Tax=Cucurbita pepo subsp. pepo TaxID=3664 RepID=UPI000C9D8939|nr:phytochrome E-like [Cucurbita pepo subsp. pepo]
MENSRGGGRGMAAFSSSAESNTRARPSNTASTDNRAAALVQYNADAGLLNKFEQSDASGESFNYSRSVLEAPQSVPEEQITAYLSKIQRGGMVQPFGCLLAIEESSLKIISYSENCFELLGINYQFESAPGKGLIGVHIRALFTPSSGASLAKAASSREISLLNPVWVYSRNTQKPFYAILHRIDVGIVIDLEPARSVDPALSLAGAVHSQKLAVRAISRLQALPGGDIGVLCDTVVEDVQKLTGYDRVMVYKFHDDEHGEVVSEIRRSDLEPYLGLHYPAIDIPQAARFLFKQNRVRMICDCHAKPVQVIQSDELKQPLCLVNSTLRSPHSCHLQYMANMGSIASLAMAVIMNSDDSPTRLWGLVVCHHTSARYVPFPLRYACEFLMQAFGLQLYMELQLALQITEKKVLKTQTLLCDMLLRGSPYALLTQSPSIKDLVKCDGAALYYQGACCLLGVTPTEAQVKNLVEWILNNHGDSTGLSTDSLADAGYPEAASLGDAICGMTAARISSKDFLFWFRSHAAKEIQWGGAKHHPDDKDDGGRMHPRSSFKAFLEVAKSKSMSWEAQEINAIHSLQLIMRESFSSARDSDSKAEMSVQQSDTVSQDIGELSSVACEMVRLIETATAPIFGVDSTGVINGWNAKIAELVGLQTGEALGRSLDEIVHDDSRGTVGNLVLHALQGVEDKNVELKLRKFGTDKENSAVYIVVNACASRDYTNKVIGVCFVGQDITSEKGMRDRFIRLQGDYRTIIESLSPLIPPIFVSDENGYCCEWTAAMEKLSGWSKDEVIGKMLVGEIFGNFCRLKDLDTLTRFMILLYQGIGGEQTEKFPLGFFNKNGDYVEVLLTSNKRTDAEGNVIGCICFLQVVEPNLQGVSEGLGLGERRGNLQLKELTYLKREMKNPLNGIKFTHELLVNSGITDNQKLFLVTSDACERQIMAIIEDMDFRSLEVGQVQINRDEFVLGSVLDAIICQIMIVVREKNIQLFHEIPEEIKVLTLCGDQIKLQLVLSDFLLSVVQNTPALDGWVEIKISAGLKLIQDGNEHIHLQIRMSHPGQGLPPELIQDMVGGGQQWSSEQGLALNLSRRLLNKLNGNACYVREQTKCYFLIDLELKLRRSRGSLEGTTSQRT